MKKFIPKIYWLFLLIFVCLTFWIMFHFADDIDSREQATGYTTITDYSVETLPDANAPKGIRQRYTFTPDLNVSSFCHLIFYTVHQEVTVSLDGETIYSVKADSKNSFGRTPGNIWNMIPLSDADRGKEIQIDLIPVYDSSIDYLPSIYYGDRYDIFSALIIRDFPALFLSLTAILAGIVYIFDLNDLKKCNDEFGHAQGDIYISTCAKLISDCFSDIGNCYRMGGDEFCVLIKSVSLEACRNRVSTLYKKVDKENEKKLISIKMAVACGYVIYDKLLDYDIQDTMRRADKMMYQEKYSMKKRSF